MTQLEINDECIVINRRLQAISNSAVGLGDSLVTQGLRARYTELLGMTPEDQIKQPEPEPLASKKVVFDGK